jgi:PadR family transcriptional regulator, regulatory protein PadR
MPRSRKPSPQTAAVVLALAERSTDWRYGYELCQQLGLKAGSMYPILMRLADRGLLATTWEPSPPAGRPPRHLYRLTGAGVALAAELAAPAAPAPRAPARDGRSAALRPGRAGA